MIEGQLARAIRTRRLVRFHYGVEDRLVEPHALGHDKSSNLILSAWQLSGEASSWRSFQVEKMSAVAPSDQRFANARQGYNRAHPGLMRVICSI